MGSKLDGLLHQRGAAFRDLMIIIAATLAVIVMVALFDVSGVLFSLMEKRHETLLDEIGFAVITLVFGLSLFSLRRWQESKRDLAERERAEKTGSISEEWLNAIFAASRDGIIVEDDGIIVYVNQSYVQMLGYDEPAQLIGQFIHNILPPDEAERLAEYGRQRLRGERPPTVYEFKAKRRDGTLVEVEAAVSTSIVAGKTYITTAIRDTTERKQSEQSLRESEEQYRSVVETALDAIITIDRTSTILYANRATEKIFGYGPAELSGMSLTLLMPDYLRHIHQASMNGYLETGQKHISWEAQELLGLHKNGHEIPLELSLAEFTKAGKHMFTGVLRDISERKQAARALIESEGMLRQSQKMEAVGTLAGGIAHDFNNLLTGIIGYSELSLRGLTEDDRLYRNIAEVRKAGQRAAVLTRQLLAFSRRQHLERRTINLNDTIGEIMKLLRRIIGEDVEVRINAASNLSAVFADPAQIEQVVMNLAVNARDAMSEGGQMAIETSNVELDESFQRQYPYVQTGKYVQLRVSDTGSGMDAETQARIFEPFYTTKEVGTGTGLGLSMVYGIIKQHEGHIHVHSEVGQGTTFKIFLPVAAGSVEKEELNVALPVPGGTETILVAEDEEALRNLARDVLEGLGYTVLLAKDGQDAVEIYQAYHERIDLLLMDVVMPRMGGWEASERIHESGGNMPLIFMTGYSSETVQSRFIKQDKSMEESGAVVLQKPYNVEGLGRKIREVLDIAGRK